MLRKRVSISLAQILYVEDEPATAAVIKLELGQASVAVTTVSNGEQCLALARKQRFDLILLDQQLPGMDGLEICRRLKSDDDLRDLPVIFFTAFPNQAQEREAQRLGAADYLLKGIQSPRLVARILAEVELARDRTKRFSRKLVQRPSGQTTPPPATG